MYLPSHAMETFGGDPLRISKLSSVLWLRPVVAGNNLIHPSTRARTRKHRALVFIIPGLAIFLCLSGNVGNSSVFAQADVASATVKGLVTDQTGAGIGQATITVTNVDRGIVRSVNSDDDGIYRVPLLEPGSYELRVDATGFQSQ